MTQDAAQRNPRCAVVVLMAVAARAANETRKTNQSDADASVEVAVSAVVGGAAPGVVPVGDGKVEVAVVDENELWLGAKTRVDFGHPRQLCKIEPERAREACGVRTEPRETDARAVAARLGRDATLSDAGLDVADLGCCQSWLVDVG